METKKAGLKEYFIYDSLLKYNKMHLSFKRTITGNKNGFLTRMFSEKVPEEN